MLASSEQQSPVTNDELWPRLRRWGANGVIVLWLLILVHQAAPFIPDRVAKSVELNRVSRVLGIWQHRWPMFAPAPDAKNQRIEAIVTFKDGTSDTWTTPDWRSLSLTERFVGSREPKFYENLQETLWSPVWPEFSRRIAAELRERQPTKPEVQRVELFLEIARIDPPEELWRASLERAPVTERHLFHVEELP